MTSTDDAREIAIFHIVDSLAPLPHIPSTAKRLIDVGSGGGFPGAVIALCRPDIQVTALEPIRKKHAFLSTLARSLPISNFHPLAKRMEAHLQDSEFQPYDVAISRATFPLLTWFERAPLLLHSRGLILAMEGTRLDELPPAAIRHPYELPSTPSRTRAVITLQQSAP